MKRILLLCTLTVGLLIGGCDGAGPEHDTDPEPQFDLALGAPLNTSIEGTAAMGSGSSFEEQSLFTLPLPQFGKTITAIQLFGEDDASIAHDLSFLYISDAAIAEGTYEIGLLNACEGDSSDCLPQTFPPDEMLTANYARLTADSLHTYMLDNEGTLTIDRATETVAEGSFTLEAALEVSVSRADLEAFHDSLRAHMPSNGAMENFPEPPPRDLQMLEPPLTIEGSFTATPGSFSDQVPGSSWMIRFGTVSP